jgi:signal transduction histidine kinase
LTVHFSNLDPNAADRQLSKSNRNSLSLRRQWVLSFLGTTVCVVSVLTFGAWWFAYQQTQAAVESRLTNIGRSVAAPNYPMTPPVVRAVAELTGTQLLLLDSSGQMVDSTLVSAESVADIPVFRPPASGISGGISIDHAFRAPDGQLYHAGWLQFEGADAPNRLHEIKWVGILIDQSTVRQMRSQALVLPLITGIATAIGLGAIAVWLTDRIVRRLQTVQRKVQRIAAGDYAPIDLSGQRDELYELSSNVNRMADELRLMEARIHSAERERLVHALAAGLSHDLRNTLTGARLAIQLHGKECTQDTESIAVAMRQLRLAEDQLMRWLRLGGETTKGGSGGGESDTQPLGSILNKVVELIRPMLDHLGSRFEETRTREIEATSIQQSELLTSAILNLLLNAIQAAGQGGQIKLLATNSTPGWLMIEIRDNGPGPSAEVQARMFDPLVTTKREGVGLGLALVAQAAKELGGEINWRRETSETVFSLQLPSASRNIQVTE